MRKGFDWVSFLLLAVSVFLLGLLLFAPARIVNAERAASRVERIVSERMSLLSSFISQQDDLPEDMVIYRYAGDTLQSWRNQFPVLNDDIRTQVFVPRLSNPRVSLRSPLCDASETVSFLNFGPKWYLVKAIRDGGDLVIAGLEIVNGLDDGSDNGVNPRLRLGDRFSVRPLTFTGGVAVRVEGVPCFKVLSDSLSGRVGSHPVLLLTALVFFLAAAVCFVVRRPVLRRAALSAAGILVVLTALYVWGRDSGLRLFMPVLYAGGKVLYSLGAVFLVNLAILGFSFLVYLVRRPFRRRFRGWRLWLPLGILQLCIVVYAHLSLSSIILDSGIPLEIYRFTNLSPYSYAVFLSFLSMLLSIPLLLHTMLYSRRLQAVNIPAAALWSILCAGYMLSVTAMLGFRKEEDKVSVWANRLSIERDIALELQLRGVENRIASDELIRSLSCMENTGPIIAGRVLEYYLPFLSVDYDVRAWPLPERGMREEARLRFIKRAAGGEAIVPGSRFSCIETPLGHVRYVAVFLYYLKDFGLSRVLLEVEQKAGVEDRGYAAILGRSSPGRINIPASYSYARYQGRELRVFRGRYAYPTRLGDPLYEKFSDPAPSYGVAEGYLHFYNHTGEDETVIVSRPRIGVFHYLSAGGALAMAAFLLIIPFVLVRRRKKQGRSYYRTRISQVMMASLILTMVTIAAASVVFVFRRNDAHMRAMMTDRTNSIQGLLQNGYKQQLLSGDPGMPDLASLIETVGANTRIDITLYAPDGRMMLSTDQEVFDRMLLGSRLDEKAYERIVGQHLRYTIQPERIAGRAFYNMYAPLMGPAGEIVAIISSPYVEENYDFARDGAMHSVAILTVFLFLLILARFIVSAMVDRMFAPISEMRGKMLSGGLGSLEYISYDRDDEIAVLVEAYNRMVSELSESSRKLAQAERDKAWSGMARQVAHEIKNPLTPMKLQIQRIIRLKQKADPEWQEKFDEVMQVLLDHIDILNATANEFSTFAKLYTEMPVRIDLDKLLQEEVGMFDTRDRIRFDYIGLSGAEVTGPKPQLTRVFVNLIGNAVQAVEGQETGGRVLVSLRNAGQAGFYDIVVEDDGPGVSPQNVEKLFTPNFTTKSGGSGLGLAISRSILERCGATIAYSRSFSLGGACFTVRYPKPQEV